MVEANESIRAEKASERFEVVGSAGWFTARFTSPYNAFYQVSGFRSRDDAIAWVTEAQVLADKFS